MKYEDAYKELSLILNEIESGQISLDDLTDKVKRSKKLIKVCKDKIRKTEDELKGLLEEE